MMLSKTTSEADIDSHRLKAALDQIKNELEVPFLEKRAKSKKHKNTPLEELNSVIQEITNREKELQAAVGIALMLLEKTDDLNIKRKKLYNKKHVYKARVQHKDKELESFKESIGSLEEKYQKVKDTLCKAEDDNLRLTAENKRLSYEAAMMKEFNASNSSDNYENEIFELKAQYNEQYEYLKSKKYAETKTELEKEFKAKEEQFLKLEKDKACIEELNEKLKRETFKQHKKIKELDEYSKELEEQKTILEDKCRELTVTNLKTKAINEKLVEDLKVYQSPQNSVQKKPKIRRHISLKCELESIEEPRVEYTTQHSYTLSRGIPEKNLSVGLTETIAHITAKRAKESTNTRRKDPSEEYFTLVTSKQITQAVKLNSPYMDAICVIPPHELYQKALKEDIPFHKWHLWVESQLNSAYIQIVYKSDVRLRP
jgi:myosin heavy subunit